MSARRPLPPHGETAQKWFSWKESRKWLINGSNGSCIWQRPKMGLTKTSVSSTSDMIRQCRNAGLSELEFSLTDGFVATIGRPIGQVTGQVTGQVGTKMGPSRAQDEAHDEAQDTGQVDPWIVRVLMACQKAPLRSREIQEVAGIRHREAFQRNYLDYLLGQGWIERTIPNKLTSRLQKYRLTERD